MSDQPKSPPASRPRAKQSFEKEVEAQNQRSRDELAFSWRPTKAPGFFLFDVHPVEDHAKIVAALKAMPQPGGAAWGSWRLEYLSQRTGAGYLAGRSNGTVGTLVRRQSGMRFDPVSRDLPDVFDSVIVQYSTHPDHGFLMSYGFVFADDVEPDLRQDYIESQDHIVTRDDTGEVSTVRERTRGKVEEAEAIARTWIAQSLEGQFIRKAKPQVECPAINIYAVEGLLLPANPEGLRNSSLYLDQLGSDVIAAAGDARCLVTTSDIRLAGVGTDSRGFNIFYRLPDTHSTPTFRRLMHEAAHDVLEMHSYLYEMYVPVGLLVRQVPDARDFAEEQHGKMKASAKPQVAHSRITTSGIHELRRVGDELNTGLRSVQVTAERHARHTRLMMTMRQGRTRMGRLTFLDAQIFPDTDLHKHCHIISDAARVRVDAELEDTRLSLERDASYISSLYASANSILNIRIQWIVVVLTIATIVLGIVQIARQK